MLANEVKTTVQLLVYRIQYSTAAKVSFQKESTELENALFSWQVLLLRTIDSVMSLRCV